MGQFGIGQPVTRLEDPRLLKGQGRYINDTNLPGQAYLVFVRSPHAHAKIQSIDISAAAAAAGVIGVYTGEDLVQAGLGLIPITLKRARPDGSPMFAPAHPGLVRDRVRFVGDPFAMVIAQTRTQAQDAAELLAVDFDVLPSVTDTAGSVAPGAPAVWDACPDNVSNLFEAGNRAATDAAIASAAHVIKRRFVITRVFAHYMETRGAVGTWDPGEDRYTLYADVQYPHRVRSALATRSEERRVGKEC